MATRTRESHDITDSAVDGILIRLGQVRRLAVSALNRSQQDNRLERIDLARIIHEFRGHFDEMTRIRALPRIQAKVRNALDDQTYTFNTDVDATLSALDAAITAMEAAIPVSAAGSFLKTHRFAAGTGRLVAVHFLASELTSLTAPLTTLIDSIAAPRA